MFHIRTYYLILSEFSDLEGEMYQLSHLLSEQRALLGSMGNSGAEPVLQTGMSKVQEEKRRAALNAVSEAIEFCPVRYEVFILLICILRQRLDNFMFAFALCSLLYELLITCTFLIVPSARLRTYWTLQIENWFMKEILLN